MTTKAYEHLSRSMGRLHQEAHGVLYYYSRESNQGFIYIEEVPSGCQCEQVDPPWIGNAPSALRLYLSILECPRGIFTLKSSTLQP